MSYMTFGTPNWRSYSAAHQHSAVRVIKATILDDSRPKAVLIQTATRTAWLPKKCVVHIADKGVFYIPHWLCEQKRLD
jgi:hypothetical protein